MNNIVENNIIDLKNLKPTRFMKPPRIIIYGRAKIGKSSFGAEFPTPVLLDVEDGSEHIMISRIEKNKIDTYAQFMNVLNQILIQDHGFGTLLVDTADFLEKILMQQVADEKGKKDFSEISYGGGKVPLNNLWRTIGAKLDEIRDKRRMAIVMIAHDVIRRVQEPDIEPFDSHTLALNENSIAYLKAWADIIGYAYDEIYTTKVEGGINRVKAKHGERRLALQPKPAWTAGNRYSLPDNIPFKYSTLIEAINTSFAAGKAE